MEHRGEVFAFGAAVGASLLLAAIGVGVGNVDVVGATWWVYVGVVHKVAHGGLHDGGVYV